MYTSRKHSNTAIHTIIDLLILASVLIPGSRLTLASEGEPNEAGAMVLMLENCDSKNNLSTPPFGDTVSLLNSKGEKNLGIRGWSFLCSVRIRAGQADYVRNCNA